MNAVNARRGEISANLDGRPWRLCLTLGALAELESAFGVDNLGELAERFSRGSLSADDIVKIVGAGLRGGGEAVSDETVRSMRSEGGAAGFVAIAVALLEAAFGQPVDEAAKVETAANPG